ncbi:hypothetical protein GF378_01180 [Candidatus Pacearchaeota archaeon]|nr:hypothetical protein [Candidatus Pacearchaeota archaeon]
MNFIKKAFDGAKEEAVHLQFQKFSKGEFRNKALIEAKKFSTGNKYKIKTSAEFANGLVKAVAKKLGSDKTKVKGAVVSTRNLKEEDIFKDLLANAKVKQFQGVKRFIINEEMSGEEILNMIKECPRSFFALSFSVDKDETKLKIKPKAPKSGKPGKGKKGGPKADFCTLKTKDKELVKSFIFEKPDFENANIKHTFFIDKLIIPEELKKTGDFAKMRKEAIRKGRIVREGKIDGQDIKKEFEFEA